MKKRALDNFFHRHDGAHPVGPFDAIAATMRRHAVALLLLRLRPWAAFTLVPYRAWKHPWRLAKLAGDDPQLAGLAPDSRFNQSSKIAWLPAAADDTAEAVALRANFYGGGGTMEFVHVHKCGGLTFSHVAPRFVCPLADGPAPCGCLLYTSPSPRDRQKSRMPSSA